MILLCKMSNYSCCWGFTLYLVEFYVEEVLWVFLPCGFLKENICVLLCCCTCLYFNDPFAYGYYVMMLNVLDLV